MLSVADAHVALTVFAEAHAQGRRVAVLGSGTLPLAAALASAGARLVHVYDAQAPMAYSPRPQVTVERWRDEPIGVRDGAFDLVLVPAAHEVQDFAGLLRELRRILAQEGCALVLFGAASTLGYEDAFDQIQLQFAHVRMFAQVPFRGVLMAELGPVDVDVTVDQSAAPPGAPVNFVAVLSNAELALESYSLIALPEHATDQPDDERTTGEHTTAGNRAAAAAAAVVVAPSTSGPFVEVRAIEVQQAAIAELSLRVTYLQAEVEREHRIATELLPFKEEARRAHLLERELSKATDFARAAEHRAAEALSQASRLAAEADRLAGEVDRLSQDLEQRAEQADRVAAAAELALAEALADAITTSGEQPGRDASVQHASNVGSVDDAGLSAPVAAPSATPTSTAAHAADWAAREAAWEEYAAALVADGEARLVERARVIAELEDRGYNARNLVRELALRATVAEGSHGQSRVLAARIQALETERAQLHAQLDKLALEIAKRDADAAVSAWVHGTAPGSSASTSTSALPVDGAPLSVPPP
jgi:SAM-dependent methyltransferase